MGFVPGDNKLIIKKKNISKLTINDLDHFHYYGHIYEQLLFNPNYLFPKPYLIKMLKINPMISKFEKNALKNVNKMIHRYIHTGGWS